MAKRKLILVLLTLCALTSQSFAKKKAAGTEDGGDDVAGDGEEDFFDSIDTSAIGRKDCINEEEIDDCVSDCENDRDCAAIAQESLCEQDCLVMCKYLDKWTQRKCVNHMVAHVSWYRDISSQKTKVRPVQKNGKFAMGKENVSESKDGGDKSGKKKRKKRKKKGAAGSAAAPGVEDDGDEEEGGDDDDQSSGSGGSDNYSKAAKLFSPLMG